MLDEQKIIQTVQYWISRGFESELLDVYYLHNKAVFSKSFRFLYESANKNWQEYFRIVSPLVK